MKKQEIVTFFKSLRDHICTEFESLEKSKRFERESWDHGHKGGGEISLLRGDVFEKAAVNFSEIHGEMFPTDEAKGPFFATGVSLITHMQNPYAPTVHMNVRYIETKDTFWFGGGFDLTPMGFPFEEDTQFFHATAKKSLDPFGLKLYPEFYQNAKEYFYIKHREKERGVGGIFFDHYCTGNSDKDFAMVKNVGLKFSEAIMPIYQKRCFIPYTKEEKDLQQQLRAHYVEFNLVYDRGTKFGFNSGGNTKAILCSMPPTATW